MSARGIQPPGSSPGVSGLVITLVCGGIAAAALAGIAFVSHDHSKDRHPPDKSSSATAAEQSRVSQLSARIEGLEHELAAIRTGSGQNQGAVPRTSASPPSPAPARDASSEAEMVRAADAEQRRVYMETVAQAFGNEKVDASWSSHMSSRVNGALDGDESLRGVAHKVECRDRTCRVEIADDGSVSLNRRLPVIALGVADVLPNVAAERVDRGDGRSAMVLYMSTQAVASAPKQ
jgi:hypothetical protein